jgi:DNA-binding Xre family transcriptional regulator
MNKKQLEEHLGLAINKQDLQERVHQLVRQENIKFSEAIMDICKELNIEPEDISCLITGPLKEKLRNEAMDFHVLADTRGNSLAGM